MQGADTAQTLLIIIAIVVAAGVGFLIATLVEIKKTVAQANNFFKTTEGSLNSTLREMEETLKGIREFTEHINSIANDAKAVTSSLSRTAENIRFIGDQLEGSVSKVTALRVGIRTAFDIFAKHLISRKGGEK